MVDDFFCLFLFTKLGFGNPFRFIPPDNFNLALLTLELEFVKKGTKNEQVRGFYWDSHFLLVINQSDDHSEVIIGEFLVKYFFM